MAMPTSTVRTDTLARRGLNGGAGALPQKPNHTSEMHGAHGNRTTNGLQRNIKKLAA